MTTNIKNYTEQGGDKTVIEGTLEISNGGKIILNGQELSPAGLTQKVSYQAASTSTNVEGIRHDFNDLIEAMKIAGLMETEKPHINIITQPQDVTVTEGQIHENITVVANGSDGRSVSYKWFSNTRKSATGGTYLLTNTTGKFEVPTNLTEGIYYYYCVLSAEDVDDVTTNVVTVTVETA